MYMYQVHGYGLRQGRQAEAVPSKREGLLSGRGELALGLQQAVRQIIYRLNQR